MPKEKKSSTTWSPCFIPEDLLDEMATQQVNPAGLTANLLPGAELMKEASRIREYNGSRDYDLSSFIREVDMILPVFDSQPTLKSFVYERYVKSKIQGAALQVIRTLDRNAEWPETKAVLIRYFGVRESYHNLYHEAFNTTHNNVSNYFNSLRLILDKLNKKYEFDLKKPVQFCPASNEAMTLKTFRDGIEPFLASIVYSRNAKTLRDAYFLLEETGLINKIENRSKVRYKQTNKYVKQGNRRNDPEQYRQIHQQQFNNQQQEPYRQHSGQYREHNNSGQFRQYNNSGQYRQQPVSSGQHRQYLQTGTSGQYRQGSHTVSSHQVRQNNNQAQPMEVDSIQKVEEVEQIEQVNFQLTPQTIAYR